MKVFLDTMVFLHYRSIDELNLDALLGPSPHKIIIPRITLRELDKHKNTNRSIQIRERARKIVKKIEHWVAGEQVRPGVTMEFMARVPAIDYCKLGLNPDWSDDVLIASVVNYIADHGNGTEVILVTQDAGIRLAASNQGLRVFELPEEYKLSQEKDPLEIKNTELIRKISALENTLPKLIVSFAGSNEPKDYERFFLAYPPDPIEDLIGRKIEELKAEYPISDPFKTASNRLKASLSQKQAQLHILDLEPIPVEEYLRYNRDVAEYLVNYRRFMEDTWKQKAAERRSISFKIEIRNMGMAPAKDVDVLFHFPDGFRLDSKRNFHKISKEPTPPIKPRNTLQQVTDNLLDISKIAWIKPNLPDFKQPSSFSIKRSRSYDVRDKFERIKHGDTALLPKIFLTFDSFQRATSFSCDYTIRPANLPTAVTGKLHFVIEKESISSDG